MNESALKRGYFYFLYVCRNRETDSVVSILCVLCIDH
jgi:hypothetical protein